MATTQANASANVSSGVASQASVASSQPEQRHLRLIAASVQANEARIRDILNEDPPWTSNADHDAMRQALQKVATRGNIKPVRLLLEYGAEINARRDNEIPALVKAAESGHIALVELLLQRGADPNWRNRNGQTALFLACMRGRHAVIKPLLDAGTKPDLRDKEGRTALLFLASEKLEKLKIDTQELDKLKKDVDWLERVQNDTQKLEKIKNPAEKAEKLKLYSERLEKLRFDTLKRTLRFLLEKDADIEATDGLGRTPLLWAATNGNVQLVEAFLSGELGKKANISAANNRGRNALHLAAESNHEEMVKLLLEHKANPDAFSDGGWTALHNAAQNGHAGAVALLLAAGAKPNSELTNGMTPLHWAAFNGYEDVVRLILAKPETNIAIKDNFDRTPMLCAAERHHKDIVQLLSPARAADRLSAAVQAACKEFEATIIDFGDFRDGKKQLVLRHSVYDLLYGWDNENNQPKIPTLTKNIKYQPDFRWIHLPANNIAWVETLLAKYFVEGGHKDIEAFKALERCFDQEHRGPMAHAHFMRTFCQRVSAPQGQAPEKEEKPLLSLSEEPSEVSTKSSQADVPGTPKKAAGFVENGTPKSDGKKKGKGEQIAERHPKRAKRTNGPPGNLPVIKDLKAAGRTQTQMSWDSLKLGSSNGKIVLFMPYLHYETDERRQRMSKAIKEADRDLPETPSRDQLLMKAYMKHTPQLHPRRTLDQFFYHGIDTSLRDQDQVVYRYCRDRGREKKIYMVDQLWLWILGKDLVITSFPQRWEQPKRDPLNVLDGIIEETNAKTRPPVQTIYDLALLITSRCSGMFDRHRLDDQDYHFLDMFESSIGLVTNQESQLFDRFNRASMLSAKWLQHTRKHQAGRAARLTTQDQQHKPTYREGEIFPDALLDIGVETTLLAEIKDIRDELNIIAVILESQTSIMRDFVDHITDELRAEGPGRRSTDGIVQELRKRSRDQLRLLDVHGKDIDRMDRQAESIYMSLTNLLDLKQKHSNALEARFARDHAVIAARQGQTIMVFTIVTIIFLPMSFIAAFFAINFNEWKDPGLTVAYVSKYLFGIGLGISIPLVAMAFTVTDIYDAFSTAYFAVRHWSASLRHKRRRRRRRKRDDTDTDSESEDEKAAAAAAARHADAPPRRSLAGDDMSHRGPNWASPARAGRTSLEVSEHDRYAGRTAGGMLSARLPGSWSARKYSVSSGNAVSWARQSNERGRLGPSADLERGREPSSSRGH